LSSEPIIPLSVFTLSSTPPKIKLSVKKTKYQAASAPAIGNPTSLANVRKSILSLFLPLLLFI
jgi:hypothetical protein